ncbi:MAG: histidine kinase [Bacteroidetes bacterium]|nr:histidine kinase [Bacteroidota bacterium]
MLRQYNSKAGLIFAVTISTTATLLPRLIRLDADRLSLALLNFIYLTCAFFFCWMIHHAFLLKIRHRLTPLLSICCCVAGIAVITWALNITRLTPLNRFPDLELRRGQVLFVRMFRAVIIGAISWIAVYYFRLISLFQKSRLENEYLKQGNLQAQLASLRQQISPHFLFNSLNTLSSLSKETAVKEYILKMSEVYRYVLQYQDQRETTVAAELAFIRSYVYILEARFEEGLHIRIHVGAHVLDRRILPFALQLLVENAVKHNIISYTAPLSLFIYDRGERLVVENDLRPRTTMEAASGTGLHNLSQRYLLTTGKDICISRDESRFKVEIPLIS